MKTFSIQQYSELARGWVDIACGFESQQDAETDRKQNEAEYSRNGEYELRIVSVETE